ncbi:MAD2 mitotic arrest deficient-like 2 [Haplosporangium gracile]|nr:MAD2 mitotic arrest deficient-like 2 [Haplosporangium gracile]
MNEQTGSIVLADVIAEFLEVAFHMIIFVRELFESTQKYSCPIKTARHPGLKTYIQQIVYSLRAELLKDTIHRICVVTLDSSTRPIDRFVFEMSVLKSFEDRLQIVQQPPQQTLAPPSLMPFGIDNHQAEHADSEPDPHHQDQNQQPETIVSRIDKGKGKAIEHQRQELEEDFEDEDVEVDDGLEKDQYDGYGGDNEQEPEEERDEREYHAEGEEGEGFKEEEECEEEEEEKEGEKEEDNDDEAPLVRKIRAAHDKQGATANAAVSLATAQTAGEWSGYEHRVERQQREIPHFGARVELTTDLETMLRAMLLKISICDARLTPLTPESSFTIVVEMKNKGPGLESKADFPWSPISPASHEEQIKVSAATLPTQPTLQQRKIIPVKTVDIADIQLELYIEKLNG